MGVSETAQWAERASLVRQLATTGCLLGRRVTLLHRQEARTFIIGFIPTVTLRPLSLLG